MDPLHNLLKEHVSRLEPPAAVHVGPNLSIGQTLALMRQQRVGSVLICEGQKLRGIFTERDALRIITKGADTTQPIRSVMTPNPVTLRSTDSVGTAIERMDRGGYRRLPIVDERGCPIGIVRIKNVIRYLAEHFPATVYNLPPVAHPTTRDREGA